MRIEEAVKARFRNQEHKTTVNIIYTAHWLEDYMGEFLKEYDLTNQQFNVLRILRGSHPHPLTQREIRERMLDKMPDVSRLLDKLKFKGLVNCCASEADRRNSEVTISQKGLDLLSQIDIVDRQIDMLYQKLTTEEMEQLNRLLDKLRL